MSNPIYGGLLGPVVGEGGEHTVMPQAVDHGVGELYVGHLPDAAAGSENTGVDATMEELERASHSLGWVDVCKGWREE